MKDQLVNHVLYFEDNKNGEYQWLINTIKEKFDFLMTFVDLENTHVIFDVGALNGIDSILFSKRFPNSQIFLFEAALMNYLLTTDNVKEFSNITPNLLGLGNLDGILTFNLFNNRGLNSFLEESFLPLPDESNKRICSDNVPVMRAETYCSLNNIKKVDLIYIDVQGFEIEVFKGFGNMLKDVSVIQAECSWKPKYYNQPSYNDVCNYLRQYGFKERSKQIDYVDGCDDCDVIFTK